MSERLYGGYTLAEIRVYKRDFGRVCSEPIAQDLATHIEELEAEVARLKTQASAHKHSYENEKWFNMNSSSGD